MAQKRSEYLLFHLKNERGALFPIAIILLFLIAGLCITYAVNYQSKLKIYNSLEFVNVRATINILTKIGE